MTEPISIADVNAMTVAQFRQKFGNIIECCPDAAAALSTQRPFIDVEHMESIAGLFLDQLQPQGKERVLLLHPELAGRLADQGQLTNESTREQKTAGLDSLLPNEKQHIAEMNALYRANFGFPFVICTHGNNLTSIFRNMESRICNSRDAELENGIAEVKKICTLRIRELVKEK